MYRTTQFIVYLCLFSLVFVSPLAAETSNSTADNWHQWRGPKANGVSSTAKPPVTWSETKNIRWKYAIKGHGTSTPIIWGNSIYLTTAINTGKVDPSLPKPEDQPKRVFGITHPNTSYRFDVICLDRQSGQERWRRTAIEKTPHEGHHGDASFASASPFIDGKHVYCWFGSAGLFCYSLDGEKQWERDLGKAHVAASLGEGCSPVVHDGKIVIVRDHSRQSTIEVLDAKNGKTLWKKNRDEQNAWATPRVIEHGGKTQVITGGSNLVRSYDLNDGSIIWQTGGMTSNVIPALVTDGDLVYCMSGYKGYSLLAISMSPKAKERVVWKKSRGTPYIPSPVLYDGMLYFTKSNQAIMTCLDAKTGETIIESTRLPGLGTVYASPVAADGRVYFSGRNGTTLVIKRARELKVVATNRLDDVFDASPAIAGNQLLLRGGRHLYCIEEGGTAGQGTPAKPKPVASPNRDLLMKIAERDVPKDYRGNGHQPYVDRIMASLSEKQRARLGALWKEQVKEFPDMENRGASFVRILDYIRSANQPAPKKPKAKTNQKTKTRSGYGQPQHSRHFVQLKGIKPGAKTRIHGRVTDAKGGPMAGVMVTAYDEELEMNASVFTAADGMFELKELRKTTHQVRMRRPGQLDEWVDDVEPGSGALAVKMKPATGEDLQMQRTAASAMSLMKWDSLRDKENFKMMCTYCHQAGTVGFRTPEKPVDWETMIRRMDGFGGLYKHTQRTIVKRLMDTYTREAESRWPAYVPPSPPAGFAANVKITEWDIGNPNKAMVHDLEPGPTGTMYAVDMGQGAIVELDIATGRRTVFRMPPGARAPHSIEPDNDGNYWVTLCASGHMGKFDPKTTDITIWSSAEAPASRGSYPHTLRVNPKDPHGLVWYTDAGRNSVFSIHPKTGHVKEYHLLKKDQAVAAGKGESRGLTPYGLDVAPDGSIWYSKLNANRIGRIDPKAPDGDIKEWNPPFRGPRRHHVDQDGIVWVPGFGSGVLGRFDPKSEQWTTYALPDYDNQIPYALNIDAKGIVWICGTGNDTIARFDPETERLIEIPMPTRVTFTREIEFDEKGNVWTCSSNGPTRHNERRRGSVIRIELPKGEPAADEGVKLKRIVLPHHQVAYVRPVAWHKSPHGELLKKIDAMPAPKGIPVNKTLDKHFKKRMASFTDKQRRRFNTLRQGMDLVDPDMENRGLSYLKILEYIHHNEKREK